jgi:hypothetical protein
MMISRVFPPEFLPAALLMVAVGGALAYLRLAPVPGAPVAAVFAPGISLPAAIGHLAGGWRLLGVAAARPFAVLLLRTPGPEAAPEGAWLLLRADGADQCGPPPQRRT